MDAAAEPLGIEVGHLLRGGAVDDHAIAVEVVVEESRERREVRRLRPFTVDRRAQIKAVV